MSATPAPLKAISGGILAGAAGTLAMDLLWYTRYRRGGGEDGFLHWEFSSSTANFDDAGAPAQVGNRLVQMIFRRPLPDRAAGLTNDIVHWATGSQWGAAYAIATRARGKASPVHGLALGPLAWGAAYALLGAAGIYKPIWQYDGQTLAKDLSAHLVFGVTAATAYGVLEAAGS